MCFFGECLAQVMIIVLNMILLKNSGEMAEMFKGLMPKYQDRHAVTLASAQVKQLGQSSR